MDEEVRRALERWPGVPDVFGWLRLDARGNWRLRSGPEGGFERIGNAALRAFIARNYAADARGRWYFQNGPQRVYAALECTPRIYRLQPDGLYDHCDVAAGPLREAWLDDAGGLVLLAGRGVGVLDDRDLAAAAAGLLGTPGGDPSGLALPGCAPVPLGRIARAALPERFGFDPAPGP